MCLRPRKPPATGAFEAAICCLALKNKTLPGTANLANDDPDCDLDYGKAGPRDFTPGPILSNSFGFGGVNAVAVLEIPQ